jgi:hypothetical protein
MWGIRLGGRSRGEVIGSKIADKIVMGVGRGGWKRICEEIVKGLWERAKSAFSSRGLLHV